MLGAPQECKIWGRIAVILCPKFRWFMAWQWTKPWPELLLHHAIIFLWMPHNSSKDPSGMDGWHFILTGQIRGLDDEGFLVRHNWPPNQDGPNNGKKSFYTMQSSFCGCHTTQSKLHQVWMGGIWYWQGRRGLYYEGIFFSHNWPPNVVKYVALCNVPNHGKKCSYLYTMSSSFYECHITQTKIHQHQVWMVAFDIDRATVYINGDSHINGDTVQKHRSNFYLSFYYSCWLRLETNFINFIGSIE